MDVNESFPPYVQELHKCKLSVVELSNNCLIIIHLQTVNINKSYCRSINRVAFLPIFVFYPFCVLSLAILIVSFLEFKKSFFESISSPNKLNLRGSYTKIFFSFALDYTKIYSFYITKLVILSKKRVV